jgi:hypothetical protein
MTKQSWIIKSIGLLCLSWGLVSCGGSAGVDEDSNAGIEVGNPSITVSAAFFVDYGEMESLGLYKKPYIAQSNPVGAGLSKLGSRTSIEIHSLYMPVHEVRNHGSDYENLGFDPKTGVQTFADDTLQNAQVNFVTGEMPQVLGRMDIATRRLKDIEFFFSAPEQINGTLYVEVESVEDTALAVPFVFKPSFARNPFRMSFHYSQLDTIQTNEFDLDIRFFPLLWFDSVDISTLLQNWAGDTLVISKEQNSSVCTILEDRFLQSFNAISTTVSLRENGKTYEVTTSNESLAGGELNPGLDLIRNGDFSLGLQDWIFVTQEEGVASIQATDSGLYINTSNGGTKDWSVQLLQEDLVILQEHNYLLRLHIRSSVASPVKAQVGEYLPPYASYSKSPRRVLATTETIYEWEVQAWKTDFFGRFDLNLGLVDNREIWITKAELLLID